MTYCLLQPDASPLPVDALKRAFAAVKGLTETDGLKAAQETWGILIRNLTRETALALQQALHEHGVSTELVEASQLPRLPDAKCIRRAEIQPETLVIYDPLGRAVPVPWGQVSLIAAGAVRHFSLAKTSTREWVHDPSVSSSLGLTGAMTWQTEVRHQFQNQMELLLDLLIGTAAMRFQIEASNFGFKGVFDRPELDLAGKVDELIQRLAQHAPHALLNQGALAGRDQASTRRLYPSKAALLDEEIWLLW